MTPIQNMLVDRLSRYFANVDEYNYKMVCYNQIHDRNYENFIQRITISRMWGDKLHKHYALDSKYRYIDSTKRNI